MVRTLEPRKNHAAAFARPSRAASASYPHRLLIASGDGWLFSPCVNCPPLGLDNQVSFLGYVSRQLAALYSAADCFLAPSLYEGFGFPVLEAMACGAPVMQRRQQPAEIAGDAALIVSPHDGARPGKRHPPDHRPTTVCRAPP